MQLGEELLARLQKECFQCPTHLLFLDRDELSHLVSGLRLGERGNFYHAVQVLRGSLGDGLGCREPSCCEEHAQSAAQEDQARQTMIVGAPVTRRDVPKSYQRLSGVHH
jgi:hypothetical protein